MVYSIDEYRFPCGHVGVEETPLAFCERSDFAYRKVDKELVSSGAVVGHLVFICHL